jgi:hypothetical protein
MKTSKELIKAVTCDVSSEFCMLENCETCQMLWKNFKQSFDPEILEAIAPAYKHWDTSSGQIACNVCSDNTFADIFDIIEDCLNDFRFHCFIKSKQQEAFQESRTMSSSNLVVAQVDFAENFTCCVQDEIPDFHFKGGNQVRQLFHLLLYNHYVKRNTSVKIIDFDFHMLYLVWRSTSIACLDIRFPGTL